MKPIIRKRGRKTIRRVDSESRHTRPRCDNDKKTTESDFSLCEPTTDFTKLFPEIPTMAASSSTPYDDNTQAGCSSKSVFVDTSDEALERPQLLAVLTEGETELEQSPMAGEISDMMEWLLTAQMSNLSLSTAASSSSTSEPGTPISPARYRSSLFQPGEIWEPGFPDESIRPDI